MKKIVVLLLLVASTAYGEIYTWKDARGTAFYSNSLHEIPVRYLSRAKLLDVATGKKLPIPAGQAGGQAAGPTAQVQPAPSQPPLVQQVPLQQSPAPAPPPPSPTAASATTQAATPVQPQGGLTRAQRREQKRLNHLNNREEE